MSGPPGGRQRSFGYFLAGASGRPPRWIGAAQWVGVGAWALVIPWITMGEGFLAVVAGFGPVHGLYALDAALRYAILPAVSLMTLALVALVLVLQVLHRRCLVKIEREGQGRWRWEGRRGPAEIRGAVRTPGGWWVRNEGRWHFVTAGYVDGEGRPWEPEARRSRGPLTLVSPPVLFLAALVTGAYGLSRPYGHYWELRREAYRLHMAGDAAGEAAWVSEHPEFRPWLLYLSTVRGCRQTACLSEQIRDRLELLALGPAYGADGATLYQLLLLNGRPRMALVLAGNTPERVFQVAVRLGDVKEARLMLRHRPEADFQKAQGTWILFLLEDGRTQEAYAAASRQPDVTLRRALSLLAVAAHLTGRCEESRRHAALLLAPERLREARLVGDAPRTGLGALQRAASEVGHQASVALGLCLLGDASGSRRAFAQAEALAARAGLSGHLDTDRILLRLVNPAAAPPLPPPLAQILPSSP